MKKRKEEKKWYPHTHTDSLMSILRQLASIFVALILKVFLTFQSLANNFTTN